MKELIDEILGKTVFAMIDNKLISDIVVEIYIKQALNTESTLHGDYMPKEVKIKLRNFNGWRTLDGVFETKLELLESL